MAFAWNVQASTLVRGDSTSAHDFASVPIPMIVQSGKSLRLPPATDVTAIGNWRRDARLVGVHRRFVREGGCGATALVTEGVDFVGQARNSLEHELAGAPIEHGEGPSSDTVIVNGISMVLRLNRMGRAMAQIIGFGAIMGPPHASTSSCLHWTMRIHVVAHSGLLVETGSRRKAAREQAVHQPRALARSAVVGAILRLAI